MVECYLKGGGRFTREFEMSENNGVQTDDSRGWAVVVIQLLSKIQLCVGLFFMRGFSFLYNGTRHSHLIHRPISILVLRTSFIQRGLETYTNQSRKRVAL